MVADETRIFVAQLGSLIGLVIATIDYGALVARRASRRRREEELELVHESGLQGLVRVLIVDR